MKINVRKMSERFIELLEWLRGWFRLVSAEQEEMMELGESYQDKYLQLDGRVSEIGNKLIEIIKTL